MKRLLFFISLLLLPVAAANANQLGQTFTLKSKYLNQQRQIVVSVPANYNDEPFYQFPVLYLTDADSQLDHSASMIHYLSDGISPMIVVGIYTPDRWNELKPYQSDKQENPKAEQLRKFIVEEVKPFINKNYRTVDYSILVGHSFGGSFATNAYLKGADDFDVFFAIAPNFAMGNEAMFEPLQQAFSKQAQPKVYFQFESITPFLTPLKSYHKLSAMLLEHKHLKQSHKVELFDGEDHMSISHIGLYRGLNQIFKDWFLYIPTILQQHNAIEQHFQALSQRLGYQVKPTEAYLYDLVSALISMEHIDKAEQAAKIAKDIYPKSQFSYVLLANVARAKQEQIKEAEHLQQAIALSGHDIERQKRYQKRLAEI